MPTNDSVGPDVSPAQPTRARYITLSFLCSMAVVLYLDRVCIAQALKPMKTEFGLDNTQAGMVLIAFTLAYGLFEIPTGRWGDRFGSRRVMTRIVLWWSVFTALTGCVPVLDLEFLWLPLSLVLLVSIRFLFGAGEAGAIPNSARILMNWFPDGERGRMQGLFQAAMHVGGMVAPVLAAWIIDATHWRWTFVIFGAVGLVWAAAFYWWFRDKPAEHAAVNGAEAQLIGARGHSEHDRHGAVPWSEALSHPTVWLLGVITTMSAFNSYFFFSWYPTYLQEARIWHDPSVTNAVGGGLALIAADVGVSNETAGWLGAIALLGATCGSLLGGWLSDLITRRAADRYRARRLLALIAFFSAAVFLFINVRVDHPVISAVFCGLACLALFAQLPTWWACSFDVSGKHTGTLFGLLNGMGVVGAAGSQLFFGAFADARKSAGFLGREQWDPAFYLSIALLLIGGILWQFIYPRRAVGELHPVRMKPDEAEKTAIQALPLDGSIREGPPA